MSKMKTIKIPTVYDLGMNGKAHIIGMGGWRYLKSYDTIVAAIDPKGKAYALYDISTATTWKHYNAFARACLGESYCGPKGYALLEKAEGTTL